MGDDLIPADARQFLLQNIDSIAEWEGLLLLRANAERKWNAYEASRNLYISEDATIALLAALASRGMLVVTDTHEGKVYQYRPSTADLAKMVEVVADLYGKFLIPVTQIIHSKGKNRVQEFANSFKLRKD